MKIAAECGNRDLELIIASKRGGADNRMVDRMTAGGGVVCIEEKPTREDLRIKQRRMATIITVKPGEVAP